MKKTCCSCQCQAEKPDLLEKFQEYLLRGTYIFCSCLIVYSLLMLNGLAAGDSKLKGENLLAYAFKEKAVQENKLSLLPNPKKVWMETVMFMDRVGGNMGDPLADTIQLYSRALTVTFVKTGDILSKVPHLLTGSPPYARAMGF